MPPHSPSLPSGAGLTLSIAVTHTTCAYNNGIFVASASGGTPPYTYTNNTLQLSNGSGIFANLPPGVYDMTVTDASGLTASGTAVLYNTSTPPFIIAKPMDPSGCSKTDGSITLTTSGGLSPYLYSLDDGLSYQAGNVVPNLGMGLYHIWVKDANGCVTAPWSFLGGSYLDFQFYATRVNSTVLLNPACGLQLSAVPSGPVCGNNGSIEFFAGSGGTPPYTYSLDGIHFAPNNTKGYTGLAPGKYTVYTRDATGLTITVSVDIPRNCPLALLATAASCGQNDGVITVTRSNGIAPYSYSIDGSYFQGSGTFTGLAPGDYTVIEKDVNGATSSANAQVSYGCPVATATAANASCGQNNNGVIVATAAGGVPPYKFSIDGVTFQASGVFSGLSAGTYTVTVTDAAGTIGTPTANIVNVVPPQITVNAGAASCTNNDGSVTVGEQGGTAPFQYSIDGGRFQDNAAFSGLDTGRKVMAVRDANGCLSSQSITVPLLDQLTVNAGNDTTICEGPGGILHASSNGTSFAWSPASGLSNAAVLNPVASPLRTTLYTITAGSGLCSKTGSVTVFVNPAPSADAGHDTILCSGKSIQLQGSGALYYQWSPATYLDNAGINDPTVMRPSGSITYSLAVTDAKGCRSLNPASVHVTVTPPGKIFVGNDTVVVAGQPLVLHAIDVNHSGFTQYRWSPAEGLNDAFSQNPIGYISGNGNIIYTVNASTPQGCAGVGSIHVKVFSYTDIFVPNAFTPNGDGHNDLLKAIPAGLRELNYFAVYNRRGQQVFLTTNPGRGWDGSFNGRPQSAGAYAWTAQGIDYKGNTIRRSGTVILIR